MYAGKCASHMTIYHFHCLELLMISNWPVMQYRHELTPISIDWPDVPGLSWGFAHRLDLDLMFKTTTDLLQNTT